VFFVVKNQIYNNHLFLHQNYEKDLHMKRFGSVLEVKKEKLDEYVTLHANVWPEVLDMIKKCNIHNYSIYLRKLPPGNYYLFSYFEYNGENFDADMANMAADPMTKKWWDVCKPCQNPLPDRSEGEWWAAMEEVFHVD
jgi:L-rhamnose mutarotase